MKTSKKRAIEMRGELGRWQAENNKTLAELGAIIGLSRTTMYRRYKDPNTFTALEMALLKDLDCKVYEFI